MAKTGKHPVRTGQKEQSRKGTESMDEPILIVDDDVNLNHLLAKFLERNGFLATAAYSAEEAVKTLSTRKFRIVLTDLRLPHKDGLELLQWISGHHPDCQTLLMTSYADVQTAVKAMKLGAADYIAKPIIPDDLLKKLQDLLKSTSTDKAEEPASSETASKTKPKAPLGQAFSSKGFIQGTSQAALQLEQHIRLVAPTPITVLISGESGTGKEYIARLIHQSSKQSQGPFVAVDCGSIPQDLAGSELFGHRKGSFTGAVADKSGFFQQAEGGTLFFDEIENLPYSVQIHLLRALQEKRIRPVGAEKDIDTHVRIIAATNEDIPSLCEKGSFRADLYHRLNEFSIQAVPLRERKEDILLFVKSFLESANRELEKECPVLDLDAEVRELFMQYNWPGNIRELLYTVKRACLLCQGQRIRREDLPPELQRFAAGNGIGNVSPDTVHTASGQPGMNIGLAGIPGKISLAEEEKNRILECLRQCNYNKTKAAKLLNIDRKTLYNKLRSYGIE